jgi:CheY-like chemotaxis protein
MPLRIAIVDDDEIARAIMGDLLTQQCDLEVVATMPHQMALGQTTLWSDIDVAIVDGADVRRTDDHFPGVNVVRHLRIQSRSTMVMVITGFFFEDALRWRMKEAGAHFYYHRSELTDPEDLVRAVRTPVGRAPEIPAVSGPGELMVHGIGRGTRINDAVDFSLERRLPDVFHQRPDPRARRWLRLRQEFTDIAHAVPINADGTPPDRPQKMISWDQIERIHRWATRVQQP